MPQKKSAQVRPGSKQDTGLRNWISRRNLFGLGENKELKNRLAAQDEEICRLAGQLDSERKRASQFALLSEIEESLKIVLDPPVAAQIVGRAIQKAFSCDVVAVLTYNPEKKEFNLLALAGKGRWYLPPSYRHLADQGLIGRAASQRKTVVANDTRLEKDYIAFEGQQFLSEMIVPLMLNGELKGVLTVDQEKAGAFTALDTATIEIAARRLVNAWDRSGYQQRLADLIQDGINLSTLLDTQTVIDRVAVIAQNTLGARFVFVTLLDEGGSFTRQAHAGSSPQLVRALGRTPEKDSLIQKILNGSGPVRIRDTRKSKAVAHLRIDESHFKGILAFPIRLHQLNIGAILAFDKQGQAGFTENDESLSTMIASLAAAAVESTWLYQQLRSSLQTATLLYQLNARIGNAANHEQAAFAITETIFKLGNAASLGLVLFTPDHQVQVRVETDADGTTPAEAHPAGIVEQAIQARQTIVLPDGYSACQVCIPLQTSHRTYGALWLDIPDGHHYGSHYSANLQSLANQATIALERSLLLNQTTNQARQLEAAYHELETTYDQTLASLTSALDARDRETEGHSSRVARIACRLAEKIGLTERQLKALERGALLHDIGKIGISDSILLKPGPLSEEEWQAMRRHPEIGAHIVEGIPFLAETTSVVRYHHEHWDGSGYPIGLAGNEIPILARIFSIVDAFDALTSNRPYRKSIGRKEASTYLQAKMGILYDPEILTVFLQMLDEGNFNDLIRDK